MAIPVRDILKRLQGQTDHAPSASAEWKRRAIGHIQSAMEQLNNDAPFLFNEREVRFTIDPDSHATEAAKAIDTLETTADPWVLKRALDNADSNITLWDHTDPHRWTGRVIRVHDPAEVNTQSALELAHEYTIREIWTAQDNSVPPKTYAYVSLDRPWGITTASTALQWSIYTRDVILPSETIQVQSVRLVDTPYRVLDAVPAEQAEDLVQPRYGDGRRTSAPPSFYWRGDMQRVQAPHYTPVVAFDGVATWGGVEPKGQFQYAYTLVIGKQEIWMHHGNPLTQGATATDAARLKPWQESALSPPSVDITNTVSGSAINITLPNMDFMEAFYDISTLRYKRSGIKVRIYRKRLAQASGSPTLDFDNRFYILDEVDGDVGTYQDDGSQTPDRRTPAPYSSPYQTLRLFPSPDRRYEGILRATWRQAPLVSETQIPQISGEAINCLVFLAKKFLYEAAGNAAFAREAVIDYRKALDVLKRRDASVVPPSQTFSLGVPSRRPRVAPLWDPNNRIPGDMFRTS